VNVSAATLWLDSSHSLIRFYEPSDARGTLIGELGYNYGARGVAFANALANVVSGEIDASGATPFSNYAGTEAYTKYSSFGELCLGLAAHQIFGHCAATAAITNDTDFVSKMNYHTTVVNESEVTSGSYDANEADANAFIATRIVRKLIALAGDDPSGNFTKIVNRVIGQDASRAKGEDNNALAPDERQGLAFYAGDTIYVTVNVADFEVTLGSNQSADQGAGLNADSPVSFTLEITLSSPDIETYTPTATPINVYASGAWINGFGPNTILTGPGTIWAMGFGNFGRNIAVGATLVDSLVNIPPSDFTGPFASSLNIWIVA